MDRIAILLIATFYFVHIIKAFPLAETDVENKINEEKAVFSESEEMMEGAELRFLPGFVTKGKSLDLENSAQNAIPDFRERRYYLIEFESVKKLVRSGVPMKHFIEAAPHCKP